VITSEILEREGCSPGKCVVTLCLSGVRHFAERSYASLYPPSHSIPPSPYYWPWHPLCRGRGRTEARGTPCVGEQGLGCKYVGWWIGRSGTGAMACALIFTCTWANEYFCDFFGFVVSFVHVRRKFLFRLYPPSLSFSLFSYVYFT
jgi:hypothetical protein